MTKQILPASVMLIAWTLNAAEVPAELQSFLKRQARLSDAEIAAVGGGTAVVKALPSKTPSEILVFGAVLVNAAPADYIKLALDINRLRQMPGYLGAGRFSSPPSLADLKGFTLEAEEANELRSCKPGACDVQLPGEAIESLQKSVNWSASNVAQQVNDRVAATALQFLNRYQKEGNRALGIYRDQEQPFDVRKQLELWLQRSDALHQYFPELKRYLLDYPKITAKNVKSLFYWEKVDFGLKPTLRLNHAIAYQLERPGGASAHVVAVKQLYASHYFQLALDLSICVKRRADTGFYLVTLKGSSQQGLTGVRGSVLRRVVVSKTLSAQEKGLAQIKRALEKSR